MEDKPLITIPNDGQIGMTPTEVKNRFDKIDNILIAVVASVLVSLVAVIISVIGLFLDQMRYNNAAYRDYSEKINIQNETLEINNNLEKSIKDNQDIILKQQKVIEDLTDNN